MLDVPYQTMDEDTLLNLLEEIVTRDGTDYGVSELTTESKVSQVLSSLKAGQVKLVFDELTESCSLCSAEEFAKLV